MLKMQHIKQCKKVKIYFALFLSFVLCCIVTIVFLPTTVYANEIDGDRGEKYYSVIDDDTMKSIFAFKNDNFNNPLSWLKEKHSFVMFVQEPDGAIIPIWNMPNIQQSLDNTIHSNFPHGYGNALGEGEQYREILYKANGDTSTALNKYGVNLPIPTYFGENSLIQLNIGEIISQDNPWSSVQRAWDWITHKVIIGAPSGHSFSSIDYTNVNGYGDKSASTEWISKYWKTLKLAPNQCLISPNQEPNLDTSSCTINGGTYTWDYITSKKGLNIPPNTKMSAQDIVNTLQMQLGKYYIPVINNIVDLSKKPYFPTFTRIFTYNLKTLIEHDRNMFGGVKDPRAEMAQKFYGTGFTQILTTFAQRFLLTISSFICGLTIQLNQFSTFDGVKALGFDPQVLWVKTLLNIFTILCFILVIIYMLVWAFRMFVGGQSFAHGLRKIIVGIIGGFFIACCALNPTTTYNALVNTTNTIFTLCSATLTNSPAITALYGTGKGKAVDDMNYYLPYFNYWTMVNTNHSLLDPSQTINLKNHEPETAGYIESDIPSINGVKQTQWSTVLADKVSTNNALVNGSVYRMVDHFMAPRTDNIKIVNNNPSFTVSPNLNYNGNIQSSIDISPIFTQVLLLVFVLFKVFIFFEFLFNIAMIFVFLLLSVLQTEKLKRTLQHVGALLIDMIVITLMGELVVYLSLLSSGVTEFVIVFFCFFLLKSGIKKLKQNNSVFCPVFLRTHLKKGGE